MLLSKFRVVKGGGNMTTTQEQQREGLGILLENPIFWKRASSDRQSAIDDLAITLFGSTDDLAQRQEQERSAHLAEGKKLGKLLRDQ